MSLANVRETLSATRFRKILPLLLILINANLLGVAPSHWGRVLASAVFLLAVSAFGMRLNVLTDRELDQAKKPELYASLSRAATTVRRLSYLEAALAAACLIALLVQGQFTLSACLVSYAVFFTLYSFNFLAPGRAKAGRLKIVWWGNFLAVCGGYLSIWLAGLCCSELALGSPLGLRLMVFAALCVLLEYAMFLNECATDAQEEAKSGLRTLPALLGRAGTTLVAFSLWASAIGAWFALRRVLMPLWKAHEYYAVAAAWYGGVAGLFCVLFLVLASRKHSPKQWDRVIDSGFWVLRLGSLVVLLVGRRL